VLSVAAAAVVWASSLRLGGGLLAGARVGLEVVELCGMDHLLVKKESRAENRSTPEELTQAEIGFSAVLAEGFLNLRLQILVSPKHIVGYGGV